MKEPYAGEKKSDAMLAARFQPQGPSNSPLFIDVLEGSSEDLQVFNAHVQSLGEYFNEMHKWGRDLLV